MFRIDRMRHSCVQPALPGPSRLIELAGRPAPTASDARRVPAIRQTSRIRVHAALPHQAGSRRSSLRQAI